MSKKKAKRTSAPSAVDEMFDRALAAGRVWKAPKVETTVQLPSISECVDRGIELGLIPQPGSVNERRALIGLPLLPGMNDIPFNESFHTEQVKFAVKFHNYDERTFNKVLEDERKNIKTQNLWTKIAPTCAIILAVLIVLLVVKVTIKDSPAPQTYLERLW